MTQDIDKKIEALQELKGFITSINSKEPDLGYKTEAKYLPKFYRFGTHHHDGVSLTVSYVSDKSIRAEFGVYYYNGDLHQIINQCKKFAEFYNDIEHLPIDEDSVFEDNLNDYITEKLTQISERYVVKFDANGGFIVVSVDASNHYPLKTQPESIYNCVERLAILEVCHLNYERGIQEVDMFLEPYLKTEDELNPQTGLDKEIASLQRLNEYIKEVNATDFGDYTIEGLYMQRFAGGQGIYHNGLRVSVRHNKEGSKKFYISEVCYYNGPTDKILEQCQRYVESYSCDAEDLPEDETFEVFKTRILLYLTEKLETISKSYTVKFTVEPHLLYLAVEDSYKEYNDKNSPDYYKERLSTLSFKRHIYDLATSDIDLFLKPYINPILS